MSRKEQVAVSYSRNLKSGILLKIINWIKLESSPYYGSLQLCFICIKHIY